MGVNEACSEVVALQVRRLRNHEKGAEPYSAFMCGSDASLYRQQEIRVIKLRAGEAGKFLKLLRAAVHELFSDSLRLLTKICLPTVELFTPFWAPSIITTEFLITSSELLMPRNVFYDL